MGARLLYALPLLPNTLFQYRIEWHIKSHHGVILFIAKANKIPLVMEIYYKLGIGWNLLALLKG